MCYFLVQAPPHKERKKKKKKKEKEGEFIGSRGELRKLDDFGFNAHLS